MSAPQPSWYWHDLVRQNNDQRLLDMLANYLCWSGELYRVCVTYVWAELRRRHPSLSENPPACPPEGHRLLLFGHTLGHISVVALPERLHLVSPSTDEPVTWKSEGF